MSRAGVFWFRSAALLATALLGVLLSDSSTTALGCIQLHRNASLLVCLSTRTKRNQSKKEKENKKERKKGKNRKKQDGASKSDKKSKAPLCYWLTRIISNLLFSHCADVWVRRLSAIYCRDRSTDCMRHNIILFDTNLEKMKSSWFERKIAYTESNSTELFGCRRSFVCSTDNDNNFRRKAVGVNKNENIIKNR